MFGKAAKSEFQRARSDAQKEERRRDILLAAHAHLAAVGFDAFSMVPVGKAAGVARGTLYLYFATREELLLALYMDELRSWLGELEAMTKADMPLDDYLRAVFTSATQRPYFLELAARATGAIETNVSLESLAESKRQAAVLLAVAGHQTALALGCPIAQGTALAAALFTLLLGVSQTMQPLAVDVALLPPDVQRLVGVEEPVEAFLRMGRWLVVGSRGAP